MKRRTVNLFASAMLVLSACGLLPQPELAVPDEVPQVVPVPAADSVASTHHVPGDFPTIQAAHDAASSGDTILVAPGTYSGQIRITKAITLASHFILAGDPRTIAATVLDGGDTSYVIELPNGAEDGATIQGFTIQNADDGISARAHFRLLNCLVTDTNDGVDYENNSGGLIQNCTIELNNDDGIDLDFAVDLIISDNVIRNNGDDGIEIRMEPYTGPLLNITINRNEIHGNGEDGIQLIHYDVPTDRYFKITYNNIYDNVDVGIGLMDGTETNEDFRAADIPERIDIFNNTFANNRYGITGGDNAMVLNNIFVDQSAIAVKNVDVNSALAFNLFFNNGTDNSGSNVDVASSVFADPVLTPALELPAGSPAIDGGTAFYVWQGKVVLDLPSGSFSGTAPDIGAFEFASGSGSPPGPPALVAPVDGAVDLGIVPTLTWTGDSDNFWVEIASDAAFSTIVDTGFGSTTQHTVSVGALDHGLTYYWRVNASNSSGTSDFSTVRSFTTAAASAPPDLPILLSPANGAVNVPLEPTLEWAGTADDFDIEVATDPGFSRIVFSINSVSTTTTLPLSTLRYETVYHWRARGNNTRGAGSFAAAFSFTTVAPPETEGPSQPQNLSSPAQTTKMVDLVWDSSTDNVGVSHYNIYRDGVAVSNVSSTNYTAVGLTPAMSYDFQVSAVDAAGNESPLSEILPVTTAAIQYALTITRDGAGSSAVTSDLAGIDCGPDCSEDYDENVVVTLSASADPGSTFSGWSGAGCAGTGNCVVTMDAAKNVTATFDPVAAGGTIDVSISANSDDAEEWESGAVKLTSSDLELTYDGSKGHQTIGMRFNGITIPQNATITNAFVQFTVDEKRNTNPSNLLIYGEASDDAATFVNATNNITLRPPTSNSVPWSPPDWVTVGDAGPAQQTPELKTVIQEIVSRPSWASGNSLVVMISGTGRRVAVSYNGTSFQSPLLHIEYTTDPPTQYTLTVTNNGTGTGTVTSAPAGIDCGVDCTEDYDENTIVTLSASADPGSTFIGWTGAGCAGTGDCVVTMDAAKNVTATFDITQHTLTVTLAGTGSGTVTSVPAGIDCGVDCTEDYDENTVVTLTASADPGSTFIT